MDAVVQFLKVVAFILAVALSVAVIGLVSLTIADALVGPRPTDVSNVTFTSAEGVELVAYLNLLSGNGPFPGVVLIPDREGLNEEMIRLANRLSAAGLTVIVPDLYRGTSAGFAPRAALLSLTLPSERALTDLQAAFDYLLSQEQVNPRRLGVVGLGSGGKLALQLAARNPNIKAAVNAYGETLTDLNGFEGAVMGVFGTRDWYVRPAQVEQFRAALEAAGIKVDIHWYPGFSGFLRFPGIGTTGSDAHVAWQALVDFLDARLIPKPSDLPIERRGV